MKGPGDVDLSAVQRPIEAAQGLPNACYVDEAWFAAERDRLFARTWTCIGVGAEVPEVGDFKPVSLLGLPLLMVRDRAGEVRVFHNVCSHRGAQLVDRAGHGPVIRCPYHSWAYGLDGRLMRTPDIGGLGIDRVSGIDPAVLGLRRVETGQWLDFVFVDIGGAAGPLDAWLRPLKDRWAHYPLDRLRHGGTADFTVRANWKLATENTMEYYHLPWVHPSLNAYSPTDAHYFCDAGNRFLGTATRDYRPARSGGQALPCFEGLTEEQRLIGEYPVVFPNLWLGVQVDHLFAMVVYPRSAALTDERLHLYFVGDASAPQFAAARAEVVERWRAINLEDIAITERLQAGRQSPGFDGGRLSPVHDHAAHQFMQMVARYLTAQG